MLATVINRQHLGSEHALSLIGQATFLESFAGILAGAAIIEHCKASHASDLYRSWLQKPEYAFWTAEVDPGKAPVGFLMVCPPDLPVTTCATDLEIKRIYLLSKFQGGGLGRRMVETAINHAQSAGAERILLGVYAGNDNAIGFYRHMGFDQIGTRSFNVGGTMYDDLVLAKSIHP